MRSSAKGTAKKVESGSRKVSRPASSVTKSSHKRGGNSHGAGRPQASRPLDGAGTAEAVPNCRFYVEIGGRATAVFTEVNAPTVETEVEEITEGGNNAFIHMLPGRTRVGNVILKSGLTVTHDLYKWYMNIVGGNMEKRNISIRAFDVEGRELMRWDFADAFPVRWEGPAFKADGAVAAIEELELTHQGLVLT